VLQKDLQDLFAFAQFSVTWDCRTIIAETRRGVTLLLKPSTFSEARRPIVLQPCVAVPAKGRYALLLHYKTQILTIANLAHLHILPAIFHRAGLHGSQTGVESVAPVASATLTMVSGVMPRRA